MERSPQGYYTRVVRRVKPGRRYFFRVDGQDRPDPASRHQPEGVHGPSEVVDPQFPWTDNGWKGMPLSDYIIYELYVGTFTREGTLDAVLPHLPELRELGVTALELMPVAQFPGERNWGYDGVFPFAVQNSYGGPAALKRLVAACHQHGMAVVLDVVYNHLGPEGNYLRDFGAYFTSRYKTPWGDALNFDGPHSDEVRRFFIENALQWQTEFHIDALRLDAVHAIFDQSATPFLQELARVTKTNAEALGREIHLIAESDLNDVRLILPESAHGCGLDAQWSDDFHHSLHTLSTGEKAGYYEDFGKAADFAKALKEGFTYTGQYSRFRKRRHGSNTRGATLNQFVVCAQNHDQIGNRCAGDRLTARGDFELLKLAAGATLLTPFTPLLFMGEEYGEPAPFQYFVSHSDARLMDAIRNGRREEFASFSWESEVPDPGAEETFRRCTLNRRLLQEGRHHLLFGYYSELIRLRKELRLARFADRETFDVFRWEDECVVAVNYKAQSEEILLMMAFGDRPVTLPTNFAHATWQLLLDSASPVWGGERRNDPIGSRDDMLTAALERKSLLLLRRTNIAAEVSQL